MRSTRLPILCLLLTAIPAAAQEPRHSGIGVPVKWEQLVLPGTELEVVPGQRKDHVVLRIVATYPHGTAFRYDLEYYGLDPGSFDLKKYFRRKDGTSADDLPPLPVAFDAKLPPGQIAPHELRNLRSPWLGGYRLALWIGGGLWVVGLAADTKPRTLADKLRPLVEKARKGELSPIERGDLERTLLAYWRVRLDLGDMKPPEAFGQLRRHPEAGPLLTALETWLHRPGPPAEVDVTKLLEPFQNLPAETAEPVAVAR
jgi:hypothetical protein